jgi:hypothetical protein
LIAVSWLVSFSLVLAACGGSSQAREVKSAWRHAVEAFAKGDPSACNYFTAASIRLLASKSGLSCRQAIKAVGELLGPDDRAAIAAINPTVTLHGERADVRYPLNSALRKLGFSGDTHMRKSGGRWLVAPRPKS